MVARLDHPCIVFSPRGEAHTLQAGADTEILSVRFEFGQVYNNPLTLIEPRIIIIEMGADPDLLATFKLLEIEAFSDRCGRHFAVNRLLQYFLLILFRHLIRAETLSVGVTRALADPRLLKALTSIHRLPGRAWTLEALAEVAGMSRASFAQRFREAIGATPIDYLTSWRLSLAQSMINGGMSVKRAAAEVGYASPAALSRVFSRRVGCSPKLWASRGGERMAQSRQD
jgi:AraC-like DNA-binding protein